MAEREDPKKLKESSTNIVGVIASHGTCARMEEGNVTNNLRELFPDSKGGCKIDCEASPRTFICYKWCKCRGVFLKPVDGAFCEIS